MRRQLGYLYLTTGGNGAGKTLFTLRDVRDLQERTGRPVFFWGFEAKQPLLDFGWQPFEPAKWEELPDGSICIVDECQKVMPTRATGQPPAWIGALAQDNRKRGFDFFFITQHPLNIDSFVRRLIAAPSWHRHFKASLMGDASNELKWSAVKDQPQKDGSGKDGEVTSRKWPREVYDWYTSTSMDTRKKGIPAKVWKGVGALLVAGALVAYVGYQFFGAAKPKTPDAAAAATPSTTGVGLPSIGAPAPAGPASRGQAPMTVGEYLDHRKPRIADFPHTAPAYDQVTSPSIAPYPAACVQMGGRCDCYTQQGTLLRVSAATCGQIVRHGFFVDWNLQGQAAGAHRTSQPSAPVSPDSPAGQAQQPRTVPVPMPAERPEQVQPISQWSQGLAARNAQVRSSAVPQ
ncbi:zonular occludens toxin domain-containing protein [Acidovorax sp. NPDC077693]|uniref:zonular occludens toxin domain-containing protein n=1 Tax=Acidovorax sp. NPDC077693 TaxID=3363889 RepID=UPI0037C9E80C